MGSWSDCSQPLELVKNGLWLKEGFKVDCKYIIMRFPIKTNNFKDQIIKYSTEQYSPFNKNGTGNQGYLFDLNQNLAKIFLEALVDNNPYLKSSDYFMKFLEQ